ncbi:MAG: AraC family transcriptional regulator [Lachnospiraceae bacterium]|nr:AraC family transcriptional regulator [Lachnospiraceae bacterium]
MNLEFPEHLHDHVEILVVLKGSVVVQIMEKRQELKAGDCAVIFPQQIHSYHAPVDSLARLFIFEDSLTGMYLHSVRKYIPSCPFLTAEMMSGDSALALERLYAISRIDRERQGGEMPDIAICSAWIQVLFALNWSRLAPERRERSEDMELTCQVIQYIMEHFQEPLTLEILAREMHANKYYISNIFSGRLQTNFRRYLNHIRLEHAMQLMKTSSAPLTDIWAEAGFNSQRSFNRAFTEIMGMAPMEYRKSVVDEMRQKGGNDGWYC